MALNQGYSTSYNVGGSQNTGESVSQSANQSISNAWSQSGTDAMTARQWSAAQADLAWQRDLEAMQKQMEFNAEEAQKQRDWQTKMANTIYTRSVKNMKKAGINPILAANMGLSGAQVGSGATASLGGAPSAPLAQNFMDSWSASQSASRASGSAYGYGHNEGYGWNEGSSYSEDGFVTALYALGDMVGNALDAVNAGRNIEISLEGLKDNIPFYDEAQEIGQKIENKVQGAWENAKDYARSLFNKGSEYNGSGGGHGFGSSKGGKKMKAFR